MQAVATEAGVLGGVSGVEGRLAGGSEAGVGARELGVVAAGTGVCSGPGLSWVSSVGGVGVSWLGTRGGLMEEVSVFGGREPLIPRDLPRPTAAAISNLC